MSPSNAAIATVTGMGYVSAVKAGTATITATVGGKSARIAVTVTAPSSSGLVLVVFDDGDTTTTSWQYSRQFTARKADGSDFKSVSCTLSDTNAFVFTDWDDGAMGTESTSKTATGRSIIVEGKYDAGTTTLTVKATRADGTVFTAQKNLVNLGSGTWDKSYWYPADSFGSVRQRFDWHSGQCKR